MTARDQLKSALCRCDQDPCYSDTIIDAFAHELAEKQRAYMEDTDGDWDGYDITNLIDPCCQRGPFDPEVTT
ncbi:hypothetical protein ACFY7C_19405 [Streptomyces sp. NPDC012769]|uniref:hypothetical protein n=1 Tax=Streptomyces sp. NPDC012769 TaxID=3364848 RepID=UPI0036AFFF06